MNLKEKKSVLDLAVQHGKGVIVDGEECHPPIRKDGNGKYWAHVLGSTAVGAGNVGGQEEEIDPLTARNVSMMQ